MPAPTEDKITKWLTEADRPAPSSEIAILLREEKRGTSYRLTTLALAFAVFGLAFMGLTGRYNRIQQTGPFFNVLGEILVVTGLLIWLYTKMLKKKQDKMLAKNPAANALILTPEGAIDRHFSKATMIPWDRVTELRSRTISTKGYSAQFEIMYYKTPSGSSKTVYLHYLRAPKQKDTRMVDVVIAYAKKHGHALKMGK